MNAGKIRIVWLGQYPVMGLQPEIAVARPRGEHPASWMVCLADALAARDEIDLHVITASAAVNRNQSARMNGLAFHVVHYAFPFTCRGFPRYLRLDLWSRYAFLRWQIVRLLRTLSPDLIHVHGTESGYGLAALDTGLPTIVTMQGIVSRLQRVSPTTANRLQASIERYIIRNTRYF